MAVPSNIFRIYAVMCMNDPHTGDYSYLVVTTGGGLNYFTRATLPMAVEKFLSDHNSQDFCLLLGWNNYCVFSEKIPRG